LPDEATGANYDASVDATLAVMRYAMGLPHHRLEQLQRWAGIPLPASTQFERVEVMANVVSPVARHLAQLAAHRPLLQSDDTGARILSLQAENQTRPAGAHRSVHDRHGGQRHRRYLARHRPVREWPATRRRERGPLAEPARGGCGHPHPHGRRLVDGPAW
jgi:hypothetical protein